MVTETNLPGVVETNLPALNDDMFFSDAGDGVDFGATDVALPFISLLQSGSPQCKKSDKKYIKGAEEGSLFNTLTQQVVPGDEGLEIIPCAYEKVLIEWRQRNSGGGFVAQYLPGDPVEKTTSKDERGRPVLPNGNELKETAQYYVLYKNVVSGEWEQAILSMTSSNLKVSRGWNSRIMGIRAKTSQGKVFTPAMFAHRYQLTTSAQAKGDDSWFIFRVEPVGPVKDRALYEAAKKFSLAVRGGEVKVAQDAAIETDTSTSTEDLPF